MCYLAFPVKYGDAVTMRCACSCLHLAFFFVVGKCDVVVPLASGKNDAIPIGMKRRPGDSVRWSVLVFGKID